MQSLRSRLIFFLMKHRHWMRLQLREEAVDWNLPESIVRFRGQCEEGARRFGKLPETIRIEPVDAKGIPAEWVLPPDRAKDRVILFVHGGGYVCGSCADHRVHAAKFVIGSNVAALTYDYRLAPEHPFPAAMEDSLAVFRWLMDQGIPPSRIIFAGDSAGGGLCLALLLAIKEQGLPLPAGALALSPWTDLACTGDSYHTRARACLSPKGCWTAFSKHYVKDQDPRQPLISPLYGDLAGLPPLLIHVGDKEIFLDDCIRFAEKARHAGVDLRLEIGRGLFHCYPVCAPLFPEATRAMEDICTFIRKCLETAS